MATEQVKTDPCGEIAQDQVITPIQAAGYIVKFWQDTNCERFGDRYGAGNFIPYNLESPIEKVIDGVYGLCIYPCVTKWTQGRDIFLTMKAATACPDLSMDIPIDDEEFLEQSNVRVSEFAPKDYSNATTMIAALRTLEYDTSFERPVQLKGFQVKEANERYKSQFDPAQNYVNAGFAFSKANDLRSFLEQKQNAKAIGFYAMLGLDNTLGSDKVRIILIAVGPDGQPMLNDGDKCLEKSWPPIRHNMIAQ